MKNIILKSGTFFSILFAGLILCAGEAWGAESAVITIGNSTSVSYANTFTSNSTNTRHLFSNNCHLFPNTRP